MSGEVSYVRQLGYFNPAEHEDATVTYVGNGGIGSFAAVAGAKLGIPNIRLIDKDIIEAHNLPNQLFPANSAGSIKTESLAHLIQFFTGTKAQQRCAVVGEDEFDWNGVVVSGFDNMKARAALWKELKLNPNVNLYIDARLGGEKIVLYSVCPWNLTDIEQYEQTLYSDDEAEPGDCTRQAIIDVGFQVAALITRNLRRHFTEEDVDKIIVFNQETLGVTKGGWIEL